MSLSRITAGAALAGCIAAAGALGACCPAAAAVTPQQLLQQMSHRFASVQDYDVIVDATDRDGSREESQRFRFAFKKPGMVRLRTLTGADKGGELVVRPDGVIRGRKNAGVIKVFAITMSRTDRRLRDEDGVGVWEMDHGSLVRRLQAKVRQPGVQAAVSGPDRPNGTYALTLRHGAGIVDRYWIDSQTLWVVRFERTRNDVLDVRRVYSGLRVNPGFTNAYFEF